LRRIQADHRGATSLSIRCSAALKRLEQLTVDRSDDVLADRRETQNLIASTENGGPGVTRTPGTQFRKLLLYPPELRGRLDLRGTDVRF
jgi:hypothetical protein